MTIFPTTKPKTKVRLIHGDCLEQMPKLASESVDVVVTSPPYNLGIEYSKFKDDQPREEYLKWTLQWCEEVKRLLKPQGSFFLNVGSSPSNPMLPHEIVIALRNTFVLQNTFRWIKSITVQPRDGEEISVGHFKPVNSKRFVTDCHEYVFHLAAETAPHWRRKRVTGRSARLRDMAGQENVGTARGGRRRYTGFLPDGSGRSAISSKSRTRATAQWR